MNDIHSADLEGPFVAGGTAMVPPQLVTGEGGGPQQATVRNALIALFYHSRLLRNCLLLGCLAGVAGALLAHTYFTADSLLLVLIGAESTSAQDVSGINPTVVTIDGLKVVQSEIQILQTDQVLRAAVEQVGVGAIYPGLLKSRWFGFLPPSDTSTQVGEAVQKLRRDLRVESEPGSSVIRLAFTNANRAIAIQVVEAVEEAYLSERRTIYSTTNSRLLNSELERYKGLLSSYDTQIHDLKARYEILDMAQDVVLATNRLDGIEQRRNQVRERRVAVQTEITAVKANLATQPDVVLDFKETTNNTGNDEARNTLVRLEQQRTHLVSLYKPDWPAIVQIDKQIAAARAQMGPRDSNLYFSERKIRNPAVDVLNNRLASLEVENKALGEQLVELENQYQQSDQRINSLREAEGQLRNLQVNRDVTEGIYRQLAQRQPVLMFQDVVVGERNANLRIVQPPTAPAIGRSMAISYLIGGIFLGLLLGAAATVVATSLRRVYVSPDEAERELVLPVLAAFDDAPTKADIGRQPGAANFGAMLQDATVDDRPLTSLQIMGISEGDDREEIVRSLAVELAVGHERKALILDLKGNGSEYLNALGMAEGAFVPAAPLPVPVVATQVPRLYVAQNSAESPFNDWRTSITRLNAVLANLRQEFSILLLVASADLSQQTVRRIAGAVDANVIIVRAEHTRAPVVMQLRDSIRSAGGSVLGLIFVGRKYYIPTWLYRWI